jgi:hypothetical protein
MQTLDKLPLLDGIPAPEVIKDRLAQLVREQQLLRSLLRVSRRKAEALERENQQALERAVQHA